VLLGLGAIGVVVGRRLLGFLLSVRRLLYRVSVTAGLDLAIAASLRCVVAN